MQALIVHDEMAETQRIGRVLARRGFMVAACSDQTRATRFVRHTTTDLLILKEVIGGRHTTSVALAAEWRNPHAATLLLSERGRADAAELFEMIPTLRAILGRGADVQTLAALAMEAVRNPSQVLLVLDPRSRVSSADVLEVA